MTITYTLINSLDEIDYDDLYERSKDVVETNWPSSSEMSLDEIKNHIKNMILSGQNNDWPGLNIHSPEDQYIMFKSEEASTGLVVGLICGYLTTDGTFEGRHSFSSRDTSGSRNFLYTTETREARDQFYRDNGISKIKYSNLPVESNLYKLLKLRESVGNYTILSDEEVAVGYRTLITQPNL